MPKINVYLPDDLAAAVRDAQVPVSAICQAALERAVREVSAVRGSHEVLAEEPAHGPFTRFTPRARTAIALAQRRAARHHHAQVGTEHLVLGVIEEGANLALRVLAALEVEPDDLRTELEASVVGGATHEVAQPPFTPIAKKALEAAVKEALGLGHNYVGCEHLLLGVLATEEGLGSQVLRRMGIELRTTRRVVTTVVSDAARAPAGKPALDDIVARLDAIERRLGGLDR